MSKAIFRITLCLLSGYPAAVASGQVAELAVFAADDPPRSSRVAIVRWTAAVDRSDARDFALAMGGDLVSVSNRADNDRLRCLRNSRILGLGPCEGPWIGLERPASAMPGAAWRWPDGSSAAFVRWAEGSPATSVRVPGAAALLEDGTWIDSLHSPETGSEIRSAAIAWPESSDGDGDGVPDGLEARGILVVVDPSAACTSVRADLDGDGRVDSADIAIVLAAWGTDLPLPDINGDGIVNNIDLGEVLAAWTGP
jgi:hypothetical protein